MSKDGANVGLYDPYYYGHCCGEVSYQDDKVRRFFDTIGERIVADVRPATVLDAGCAMGYLVGVLRRAGVAAWGVDVSEYAVANADADARPFCKVGSVLEPFGREYDLVVCMEVLEHLKPDEAERAVENLCRHGKEVLFSSTPLDYKEATHFNVRPTEYWVGLFARHGFFRDVEYDAAFVAPWAVRFRRTGEPVARLLEGYERRLAQLGSENRGQRDLALEHYHELARLEAQVREVTTAAAPLQATLAEKEKLLAETQQLLAKANKLLAERTHALDSVYASRAWRLAQRLHRLREAIAPPNSARGELLRGAWRALKRACGRREPPPAPPKPDPVAVAAALSTESADYAWWIKVRLRERRDLYPVTPKPGLLSFVTSAYNTPVKYLHVLAESLLAQKDEYPCFEWVVLDNGSTDPETAAYLRGLEKHEQVRLFRVEQNLGIIGGMRFCLERATGRYILPLDSDDYLYPDCLRIMAWHIEQHGHPPLLYSDEDRLTGERFHDGFFKAAWDPVLFLNSCYIAHLCAIDRELALRLGAYSDPAATGCHDWDTFLRFMLAGHKPVHVPEVIYSWRLHEQSCALDHNAKPYIYSSHKHVLNRFVAAQAHPERYRPVLSPLFGGLPHWWIRRERTAPRPLLSLIVGRDPARINTSDLRVAADYPGHEVRALALDGGLDELRALAGAQARRGGLIHLVAQGLVTYGDEWPWEALGLFELHPDAVMVGGRVINWANVVVSAGEVFGVGGPCGCPDLNRVADDGGWCGDMFRQRSVSAVSSMLAVFEPAFLVELLERGGHPTLSLPYLGAWAGAYAARTGRRVICTPHLTARAHWGDVRWSALVSQEELRAFTHLHRDLMPDTRFYARYFSLNPGRRYSPASATEREIFLRLTLPPAAACAPAGGKQAGAALRKSA